MVCCLVKRPDGKCVHKVPNDTWSHYLRSSCSKKKKKLALPPSLTWIRIRPEVFGPCYPGTTTLVQEGFFLLSAACRDWDIMVKSQIYSFYWRTFTLKLLSSCRRDLWSALRTSIHFFAPRIWIPLFFFFFFDPTVHKLSFVWPRCHLCWHWRYISVLFEVAFTRGDSASESKLFILAPLWFSTKFRLRSWLRLEVRPRIWLQLIPVNLTFFNWNIK